MSWYDWFKPLPQVGECDPELDEAEYRLNALKLDHSNLLKNMQDEYQTLSDLRAQVARLRRKKIRFEESLSYKKMQAIIEAQTETNRFLTESLKAACKRAEDEAIKNVIEDHYHIQTGSHC